MSTLAGSVSGNANGVGSHAKFVSPVGVAYAVDETFVLISDSGTHSIRRYVFSTGAVTTVAGSTSGGFIDALGTSAKFNVPRDIAVHPSNAYTLIADAGNNRIRKMDANHMITSIVGSSAAGNVNGVGTIASMSQPFGIAITPDGLNAYITEGNRIRQLDLQSLALTTLAGSGSGAFQNGIGTGASFLNLCSVAVSNDGVHLFVADVGFYDLICTFIQHCY